MQAAKDEREAKRARLELEAEERLQLYLNCHPKCTCGEVPCPMAGLVRCHTCGDIKKHMCRKAACVAVAPLTLTMVPAPPAAPLALTEGADPALPVAVAVAAAPAQ